MVSHSIVLMELIPPKGSLSSEAGKPRMEDLKRDRDRLGILPKKWLAFLDEVIVVRENS